MAARPRLPAVLRALTGGLLLLRVLLAAWSVRLPPGGPGWYPDEGAHIAIAHSLLRGRAQFLAVHQSVLLFSRLPLFEWLLAGALALAGAGPSGDPTRGLAVLRALTGWLGLLNTLGLYLVARPLAQGGGARRWLPLLAAGLFVVYPAAVTAGRFGFSYHLLATGLLGAVWAAGRYLSPTGLPWHLAVAALSVGLGALTDVWGWSLIPLLLLMVLARHHWGRPWRAALRPLALAAGLALLPLALFAAHQLLTVPAAFLFDLRFVLGRVSAYDLRQQAALLAENAATLLGQDGWLVLGLVGLCAVRPAGLRTAALLFGLGALLLLGRTTPLFSLSFYYLIPLLPLVPLGLAALVGAVPGRVGPWIVLAAVAGLALSLWVNLSFGPQRAGLLSSPLDEFLVQPPAAQAVAAYLAAARTPDQLVLASPGLAWLLPGHVADVQMALAYTGQPTPHLPATLPPSRYAYSPAFARAQWVVVDDLWRNWAVYNVGGAADLLAQAERWPVAFQSGALTVYRRP